MPSNADHEPYFLGALLAMAQAHFYAGADFPDSTCAIVFDYVRVQLLTNVISETDFIVYDVLFSR